VSFQLSLDRAWACLGCRADSGWVWALLGGTVLLALVRLRFPTVALVGAVAFFALRPAFGGLLALTAFRAAGRGSPERRLRIAVASAVVAGVLVATLPFAASRFARWRPSRRG
jgi:hypothetical protein